MYGQPINITVNADGVNTACTSHFELGHGLHNTAAKYEFVEGIAPQETFLIQNARGAAGLNVMSFPAGYLWPLITQTE